MRSIFLKIEIFDKVFYMRKKEKKRKPWGEEAGDLEEDWEDHSDFDEDEEEENNDDDDDDDDDWDEEDWDGNDDDWDDDY